MKKIILTGASGFLGRNTITPLLEKGYEIHAFCRNSETLKDISGLIAYPADILNTGQTAELVRKIKASHLMHLAWYMEHSKNFHSEENLKWIGASINLVMEFCKNGGTRALIAGSCSEYDPAYGYCHEELTPKNADSLYGKSKYSLYLALEHHARTYSLSLAWTRLFFLYGPHEHPARLVSAVTAKLLRNQPADCSHGEQVRDYTYIRDAASANIAVMESDVLGAVNVGSGDAVKIRDVVSMIGRKLNKPELIRLGAIKARPGEAKMLVADTGRLNTAVGWKCAYSLDAGLDETIAWWRKELKIHE